MAATGLGGLYVGSSFPPYEIDESSRSCLGDKERRAARRAAGPRRGAGMTNCQLHFKACPKYGVIVFSHPRFSFSSNRPVASQRPRTRCRAPSRMVLRFGGRRAAMDLGRSLVAWLRADATGGSSNGDDGDSGSPSDSRRAPAPRAGGATGPADGGLDEIGAGAAPVPQVLGLAAAAGGGAPPPNAGWLLAAAWGSDTPSTGQHHHGVPGPRCQRSQNVPAAPSSIRAFMRFSLFASSSSLAGSATGGLEGVRFGRLNCLRSSASVGLALVVAGAPYPGVAPAS